MIKIDKNIPIPPTNRKCGAYKYPFAEMKVGDSFFTKATTIQQVAQLRSGFNVIVKKIGGNYKITTKKIEGGLRVWRVE